MNPVWMSQSYCLQTKESFVGTFKGEQKEVPRPQEVVKWSLNIQPSLLDERSIIRIILFSYPQPSHPQLMNRRTFCHSLKLSLVSFNFLLSICISCYLRTSYLLFCYVSLIGSLLSLSLQPILRFPDTQYHYHENEDFIFEFYIVLFVFT